MVPKWRVISIANNYTDQVVTTPGASCNENDWHFGMLLTRYITCIIITQGYYGTFRGDFSIFETLIVTKIDEFGQLGPAWWNQMHLFVAILENGRHVGFSIYQSDRIYLITIQMSHANFGACIAICTIHPKNTNYIMLHCKSVTTCPNGNVTTCPNVISLTKFEIVDKYGVPIHLATYIQGPGYSHNHEQV